MTTAGARSALAFLDGIRDLPINLVTVEITGGAAGNHTVTGIAESDVLWAVLQCGRQVEFPPVAGGAAGNHTVTGIQTTDILRKVWEQDGSSGLMTDLTSEFTIDSLNTIDNTAGTSTSGDFLETTADRPIRDLTDEFSISAANTIENAGGSSTAGEQICVMYVNLTD